ncbi:MAG: glutamate 5-kinase [Lachnospiraceae bacterium]|nr:glutamate 5-kinase [Lachnospiraceae bacterium]
MNIRDNFKAKKRIVVKVGSSSLTHKETGRIDLNKIEVLIRELCDLRNQGKDVILVSSGAIAVGKTIVGIKERPDELAVKQACAAIGQCRLMMIYQKIFAEYNHIAAQVLMTKKTVVDNLSRYNAHNTFLELMNLGVIPIVNENDTVSTFEIEFGDNDTLSAIVTTIAEADLLILLSDIDGLFTDDPNVNPEAEFVDVVEELDETFMDMGKDSTGSKVGTGGMATKLNAAKIAVSAGADMVIANAANFHVLHDIMEGKKVGTVFRAHKDENYNILDYLGE